MPVVYVYRTLCYAGSHYRRCRDVHSAFLDIRRDVSSGELPDRLREHVIALSETFYPRNYTHTVNTERVADYIADHFAHAGAEVFPQMFDVQEPEEPAGAPVFHTRLKT